MIVAVDETGDFDPKSESRHFHIACHIRTVPVAGETKQYQHKRWERSLGKSCRSETGEIKGALLGSEECDSFVDEVVLAKPSLRISLLEMRPADNSLERITEHQTYSVASCNDSVLLCARHGNTKGADHYRLVGDWMRALSPQQYLKVVALTDCVAHSIFEVVGHAITGKYDTELADLEYKIDRDFVRPGSPRTAWNALLYEAARKTVRGDRAIPFLPGWTDEHPFVKRYGGLADFNIAPLFLERTHFLASHQHWELRIADVVATLVQRAHNQQRDVAIYNRMAERLAARAVWPRVALGGFDAESTKRRPFEE